MKVQVAQCGPQLPEGSRATGTRSERPRARPAQGHDKKDLA